MKFEYKLLICTHFYFWHLFSFIDSSIKMNLGLNKICAENYVFRIKKVQNGIYTFPATLKTLMHHVLSFFFDKITIDASYVHS